jgi:HrpA-like RNA helicase
MTDGIAKESIGWMSENNPLPFDIIMIDEVHERGRNIDLLIA